MGQKNFLKTQKSLNFGRIHLKLFVRAEISGAAKSERKAKKTMKSNSANKILSLDSSALLDQAP